MFGFTLIQFAVPDTKILVKVASTGSVVSTVMMSAGLSVLAIASISALVAEPSLIQVIGALAAVGSIENPAPSLPTYNAPEDSSFSRSATKTLVASFREMEKDLATTRETVSHKEEEILARERLLASVVHSIDDGIVAFDAKGRITAVNEGSCRLFRRAESAMSFLVDLGIPASRLTSVSYGKEKPVDSGQNEASWAKNRRVHFEFKK